MSWKAGDLALCVRGGKIDNRKSRLTDYPRAGAIYTVVRECINKFSDGVGLGLLFKDAPLNECGDRIWREYRFIKVTPEKADKFDREIIKLMKEKEHEFR